MKKYITIIILSCCYLTYAQNSLTDNDINFRRASYNTSLISADSSMFALNLTTSLGNNTQETSRLHFLAYGNIPKIGLAVGAKVNSRFKNFMELTTAELLVSKSQKLAEKHYLNLGLNLGVLYSGLNKNYLNNYVDLSDQAIQGYQNKVGFLGGFGLSYVWDNKLEVGFSMPELIKSESKFYPTFFANAAYKQPVGANKALYVQPAVLAYSTNVAPLTFEGAATVGYKEYAWLKVGGRSTKTMLLGVGAGYSFINVGYVYNMNFGNYENINQAQHNINVFFKLNGNKNVKKADIIKLNDLNDYASNTQYDYTETEANQANKEEDITSISEQSGKRKLYGNVQDKYYLVSGVFNNSEEAKQHVDMLLQKGSEVYVMLDVNTREFVVCVGNATDVGSVVSLGNTLQEKLNIKLSVVEND